MAKLYWRVKKDGKWQWKPARVTYFNTDANVVQVSLLEVKQE